MTEEEERALEEGNFLFQEPDSALLLSSGVGRQWPDARGVFLSESKDLLAWVNYEDHVHVASMVKGAEVKAAFERLCEAQESLQGTLQDEGYDFMHSDHLGFIA